MDESQVKGLLASAGKAIARLPAERYEETVEKLRAVVNSEEFALALDTIDLGVEPQAQAKIRDMVAGDKWDEARGRLLLSAEHHRVERMSPSS